MPINTTQPKLPPEPEPTRLLGLRPNSWLIILAALLITLAAGYATYRILTVQPAQAQERGDICRIQEQLAKKGFYEGEIDCSNGPSTRAAVKAFQRREGLFVDGEVGEDTYKRLFGRFRHEPEERGGDGYSERRAIAEGERCAEEPIEATVMRATEQRGKSGAVKAWEAEVLRRDGLGLSFSTWGDATDVTLNCKKIASWNWNCSAKGRPCRGK